MNKKVLSIAGLFLAATLLSGAVFAQERRARGREPGMMLDLTKFSLGTMNKVEDKKQYLSTIQLEKQRIQNYTLGIVYENAYLMYRRGDYQRAEELAQAILTVDPEFKNARTLAEQAHRMGVYGTVSEAEIIAAKQAEGQRLYDAGRLVEADRKFEEILAIQPHNTSARNWQAKVEKEIASEHERRGDVALRQKDYEKALDQWYSALLIRKDDSALVNKISKTERLYRDKQLQSVMKEGAENYTNGKYLAAYDSFQKALKIQPAEPKAQKFSNQLRTEIAKGYVDSGNKYFASGRYDSAIANWKEGKKWGYDSAVLDAAIKKANNAKAVASGVKKTSPKPAAKPGAAQQQNGDEFDPGFEEPQFQTSLPTVDNTRVSEENRRLSQEAYLRGTRAFNDEDYETARKEWTMARQLDPGNSDAEQGLKRVQELLEVR